MQKKAEHASRVQIGIFCDLICDCQQEGMRKMRKHQQTLQWGWGSDGRVRGEHLETWEGSPTF